MTLKETQYKLNVMAKDLIPDMQLEFYRDHLHFDIFKTFIRLQSEINIDFKEVVHKNVFSRVKAKDLLIRRIRQALLEMKKLIENDLEKIGEII